MLILICRLLPLLLLLYECEQPVIQYLNMKMHFIIKNVRLPPPDISCTFNLLTVYQCFFCYCCNVHCIFCCCSFCFCVSVMMMLINPAIRISQPIIMITLTVDFSVYFIFITAPNVTIVNIVLSVQCGAAIAFHLFIFSFIKCVVIVVVVYRLLITALISLASGVFVFSKRCAQLAVERAISINLHISLNNHCVDVFNF